MHKNFQPSTALKSAAASSNRGSHRMAATNSLTKVFEYHYSNRTCPSRISEDSKRVPINSLLPSSKPERNCRCVSILAKHAFGTFQCRKIDFEPYLPPIISDQSLDVNNRTPRQISRHILTSQGLRSTFDRQLDTLKNDLTTDRLS